MAPHLIKVEEGLRSLGPNLGPTGQKESKDQKPSEMEIVTPLDVVLLQN